MPLPQSDAFVFFGAMGDLAFKKIFPSLQAMIKRGTLDVPVIAMAGFAKGIDELRARARSSLSYVPGEGDSGMFGGNSNWRGRSGPEEQCGGRQRECEQASLVQSEWEFDSPGPEVAEPPDHPR